MSKIRSTKELLYDSRNNKSSLIELEVRDWNYNSSQNFYETTVNDFAVDENEVRILINTKKVVYPAVQIDALFNAINKSIQPNSDVFTEKLTDLIADCLLYVTVNDAHPIYGSEPTDWVKVIE